MRGSERQGSLRVGRIYRKLYAHGFAQAVLEMGEVQTAARTFGLEVTQLEIGKAATSLLRLGHTTAKQTRFTLWTMLSLRRIARASSHLRWERACQRFLIIEVLLKSEVFCPMAQTSQTCSSARLTWSTKFFAVRSRPISRSNSLRNLI